MKNMSIKSLSYIILVFIAIYGAFMIYSATRISGNVDEAEWFWLKYQDISSPRTRSYNSLVKSMGYGAMIHQFKNYVLRKDEARIAKVRVAAGRALAAIDRYSEAATSSSERLALRDIKSVVENYAQKINIARKLVNEGKTARQIDRVVKIDDGPAIRGLTVLESEIMAQKIQRSGKANRVELLGHFQRSLGFGNMMIHQFKNYVLRQNEPRIGKVQKAVANMRETEKQYRAFPISAAEDRALASLMGVVSSYESNLDVVKKLVGEGKTPEEIDKVVKINDSPALSALQILRGEISKKIAKSKARTTAHLANTKSLAKTISIGSAAGLAALMALIAYVLFSHVLGPIDKISKSIAKFIDGDLDVKFQGTERKDELGYLSRTIDKLRTILISYALRQSRDGKKS